MFLDSPYSGLLSSSSMAVCSRGSISMCPSTNLRKVYNTGIPKKQVRFSLKNSPNLRSDDKKGKIIWNIYLKYLSNQASFMGNTVCKFFLIRTYVLPVFFIVIFSHIYRHNFTLSLGCQCHKCFMAYFVVTTFWMIEHLYYRLAISLPPSLPPSHLISSNE